MSVQVLPPAFPAQMLAQSLHPQERWTKLPGPSSIPAESSPAMIFFMVITLLYIFMVLLYFAFKYTVK